MKKISILFVALSASMMLSAVDRVAIENTARPAKFAAAVSNDEVLRQDVASIKLGAEKAPKADYADNDWYYCPTGNMYGGITADFHYYPAMFMVPFMEKIEFKSVYGPTTWTIPALDTIVATKSQNCFYDAYKLYSVGGAYSTLPQTEDQTVVGSDKKEYLIKGHQYGEMCESGNYLAVSFLGEDRFMPPMTNCGYWTSSLNDEEGNDMYMVTSKKTGDAYYNTKMKNDKGIAYDNLGMVVSNAKTMYIESINVPIFSMDNTATIDKMLPKDKEINVTIYPIVNNQIRRDEPMYEATVTSENFVEVASYVGSLVVTFTEVDEFGLESEIPAIVTGDFYLEFSGFAAAEADFAFFTDLYCPAASTVYMYDASAKKLTDFYGNGGLNLAVSLVAYWPELINDAINPIDIATAPMAGGPAVFSEEEEDYWLLLETNSWDPESELTFYYETEDDEWIEVLGADFESLFEDYGVIGLVCGTKEANDGYDRSGKIIFYYDGAEYALTVNQPGKLGPNPEAINNVESTTVKAVKSIKNGQLLIKKGDKIYNAQGQKLAE